MRVELAEVGGKDGDERTIDEGLCIALQKYISLQHEDVSDTTGEHGTDTHT